MQKKSDDSINEKFEKFRHMYFVLVKWMTINQNGRYIANYFKRNNYKRIAIYGMKELGYLFYDEMVKEDITIEYIVDKNADNMNIDVEAPLYTPDDELPNADIMVITAVHYYDEIVESISDKVTFPVKSLEEIIKLS